MPLRAGLSTATGLGVPGHGVVLPGAPPSPPHSLLLPHPQVPEEDIFQDTLGGPKKLNLPQCRSLPSHGERPLGERQREKSVGRCLLPPPPQDQKRGPGTGRVASGFSWLLSDLGQGVGWHQAPLLAAADADEAVSILAPAHAHTDLSQRDMELRPGPACSPGPESC